MAERIALKLQECQYGIQIIAQDGEPYIAPCGEIAVAKWSWGPGHDLYVCEEHDKIVEESEEEVEDAD